MEPDQLAGEQCLNAERPVHEYPPISGGRPASRPRCATGAHCDIRRSARLLARFWSSRWPPRYGHSARRACGAWIAGLLLGPAGPPLAAVSAAHPGHGRRL